MALSVSVLTRLLATATALCILTLPIGTLRAAEKPAPAAKQAEPPAKPANTEPRPQIPDNIRLGILVHSYMVALSQANLTGNYSVLHALGAPDFQQRNPPEKLAQIFSGLRQGNIDLTPIIVYSPTLDREPAFDENGMLRLNGYYKTEPQRVYFDLTLQPVNGMWRLYGISVSTGPAPPSEPAKPAEPARKAPEVAKKKPIAKKVTPDGTKAN